VNFLVPNYAPKRNTHTHKEGFFCLLPNYARKKRGKRKQKKKKKKKKEQEEETEQEKEGSGICSFSQMEVKEQDIHDDHRHPNEACLPANELPILGNSSSPSRHRSIPSKPKQSRASEGASKRASEHASKRARRSLESRNCCFGHKLRALHTEGVCGPSQGLVVQSQGNSVRWMNKRPFSSFFS